MTAENVHEVKEATRKYIYVFIALLVGTLITVIASYVPFGSHAANIAVGLFIACCKAFLVAGYFMHLISERKLIYGLLGATGFFFVGLMALILWAKSDQLFSGFR